MISEDCRANSSQTQTPGDKRRNKKNVARPVTSLTVLWVALKQNVQIKKSGPAITWYLSCFFSLFLQTQQALSAYLGVSTWIVDVNKDFSCVVIFFFLRQLSSSSVSITFRLRGTTSNVCLNGEGKNSLSFHFVLLPAGGLVSRVPKNTLVVKIFSRHKHCVSSDRYTPSLG